MSDSTRYDTPEPFKVDIPERALGLDAPARERIRADLLEG